jgi:hypothetical protein
MRCLSLEDGGLRASYERGRLNGQGSGG